MCDLDYFDLLYLVQEHEIMTQKMLLEMNKKDHDGREVFDMTPEATSNFFVSGIKKKR